VSSNTGGGSGESLAPPPCLKADDEDALELRCSTSLDLIMLMFGVNHVSVGVSSTAAIEDNATYAPNSDRMSLGDRSRVNMMTLMALLNSSIQ